MTRTREDMGVNRTGPPSRELRRDFGLEAESFTRWPVGFESECWIVDDRWFVKIWHDRDHPADLAARRMRLQRER